MTSSQPSGAPSSSGVLARVDRFEVWLVVVMAVVVVTCAVRYLLRHGLADFGVPVLIGAAVLWLSHAWAVRVSSVVGAGSDEAVASPGRTAALATVVLVAVWMALTLMAPSFAWCAVPVAFVVLRVLPWPWAVAVVVAMTALVPLAWWRLLDDPDPTVIVGPVALAVVTVVAYRALDRESRARQRLLDQLAAAREDLAEADRRAGALSERARLSREIHDSVGQGLSSVSLMLNAARQEWQRDPARARAHVDSATAITRSSLDDVRRVVRDLAPAGVTDGGPHGGLEQALRRVLTQAGPRIETTLHVVGDARSVPPEIATALVRTAQGALANVVEHSGASRLTMTLTRHPDAVLLDVHDNGRGFVPAQVLGDGGGRRGPGGLRGHGLAGLVARADELGGEVAIESAPGEGAVVSVRFPLTSSAGRGD